MPERITSALKEYLGDSVYADFDGYHIILTTENGHSDDPRNRIGLEPAVMHALKEYQKRLERHFAAQRQGVSNA